MSSTITDSLPDYGEQSIDHGRHCRFGLKRLTQVDSIKKQEDFKAPIFERPTKPNPYLGPRPGMRHFLPKPDITLQIKPEAQPEVQPKLQPAVPSFPGLGPRRVGPPPGPPGPSTHSSSQPTQSQPMKPFYHTPYNFGNTYHRYPQPPKNKFVDFRIFG